jgi:plasmid stabilization system protein ParE
MKIRAAAAAAAAAASRWREETRKLCQQTAGCAGQRRPRGVGRRVTSRRMFTRIGRLDGSARVAAIRPKRDSIHRD